MPGISSSTKGPMMDAGPWPRARRIAASRKASSSAESPAEPRRSRYSSRIATGACSSSLAVAARPRVPAPSISGARSATRAAAAVAWVGPPGDRGHQLGDHHAPRRRGRDHDGRHAEVLGGGRAADDRDAAAGSSLRRRARAGDQRALLVRRVRVGQHERRDGHVEVGGTGDDAGACQRGNGDQVRKQGPIIRGRGGRRVSSPPRQWGDGEAGFKATARLARVFVHRAKDARRRLARRHKAPVADRRRKLRRCLSPDKEGPPRYAEIPTEERARRPVEPQWHRDRPERPELPRRHPLRRERVRHRRAASAAAEGRFQEAPGNDRSW